jgi:hypothetical protein
MAATAAETMAAAAPPRADGGAWPSPGDDKARVLMNKRAIQVAVDIVTFSAALIHRPPPAVRFPQFYLLFAWTRRVRHISLHRSDWERNEPFALTVSTQMAHATMDHIVHVCDLHQQREFILGLLSGTVTYARLDADGLLDTLIGRESSIGIFVDRSAMNWVIDALLRHGLELNRDGGDLPSPLFRALSSGMRWVGPLLDHGVDVNRPLHGGALFRGVQRRGVIGYAIVNSPALPMSDLCTLVSRCDDDTLNRCSYHGDTPLMTAASRDLTGPRNLAVLRVLLERAHGDGSGVDIAVGGPEGDAESGARTYLRLMWRKSSIPILEDEFARTRQRIGHWRTVLHGALNDVIAVGPLVALVEAFVITRYQANACPDSDSLADDSDQEAGISNVYDISDHFATTDLAL